MKISVVARRLATSLLLCSLAGMYAGTASADELAFKRVRLSNGLTVLVHEDHKAPIVSVGVWYATGSADDPADRSGIAHLSEHLMFYGSEHHAAPHLDAIRDIGGANANGLTGFDEMAYYETVPTEALDKVLWLESDRMGHLLGALDDKKLDTQRSVVLNERRELLESPYGRSQANLLRHLFPADHPYHRDGHGVPDDLDKVSLDGVRSWFRQHHGAANATLVMVGDITPEAARVKAMTYFAHIAPGPERSRQRPWVVPLAGPSRGVMHDKVAHRRIVRAWPVPEAGSVELAPLQLAATVLGQGDGSRLHHRLVTTDGLASHVEVTLLRLALASCFVVSVDVADGVELAAVESALDDELATFSAHGPSRDEWELARTSEETAFLASTETTSGKMRALALGQLRHDDPTAEWEFRERMAIVEAGRIRTAVAAWLNRPAYTLIVMPAPAGFDAEAEDASDAGRGPVAGKPLPRRLPTSHFTVTTEWSVDRTRSPAVGAGFPRLPFPALERGRLSNGVELVLAGREGSAFAHVRFQFDRGPAGKHPPGTANFVMSLLTQGGDETDAAGFARQVERMGATFDSGCDAEVCFLDLAVPRHRLASGVALMAGATRNAAFRPADIERVRRQQSALADARQAASYELAAEIMARLRIDQVYPYADPAHSPSLRESIVAVDEKALRARRDDMLRPDNLRVIVVGNVSKDMALAALKSALGDWKAPDEPLSLPTLDVGESPGEVAYLVDRPQARQSHIVLGLTAPRATNAVALELANRAFAAGPGSRLDTSLRDAKGWTYGVFADLAKRRGARPLTIEMPVQADRTADAIAEVRREIALLAEGKSPLADTEVNRQSMGLARSLVGVLERNRSVLLQIAGDVKLGRSDDFLQTLPETLRGTSAADADRALKHVLKASRRTWVIVGDRKHIEDPLREQFPGLRILDVEGRVVE